MKKIIIFLKEFLKISLITFILVLSVYFFFGNKILETIDPYLKETEFYDKRIRIWDETYHHSFKKNINMKSIGFDKINRFCTNNFGFKSNCNSKKKSSFKYAFLGDSFTEGIGLNYENTFVGIFEKKIGSEVANMGVSSYSPKLHLAKINFFLNKGMTFDHVILFLDISDYYDEAHYKLNDDKLLVIHNKKELRRIWSKKTFPFTNYYFYVLKKIRKNSLPLKKNLINNSEVIFDESVKRKTSWLDKDINNFKINNKSIYKIHNETKNYVEQIYKILKKKNIKFSLAIYPWPQNFINKKNNSFYRSEWKTFCQNRCTNFLDYFEDFNNNVVKNGYDAVYEKFYINNDVHFNKMGNILIADKIIKTFLDN